MSFFENENINGKYRHYKGGKYEVIGEATHSETEEKMIVYKSVLPPHTIWVRPYDMFFETITVNGKDTPRFKRMDD